MYQNPFDSSPHPTVVITPLGVLLDEELHELQIVWTATYLPDWIDAVHNTFNPAHTIKDFLGNQIPMEEDPDPE